MRIAWGVLGPSSITGNFSDLPSRNRTLFVVLALRIFVFSTLPLSIKAPVRAFPGVWGY